MIVRDVFLECKIPDKSWRTFKGITNIKRLLKINRDPEFNKTLIKTLNELQAQQLIINSILNNTYQKEGDLMRIYQRQDINLLKYRLEQGLGTLILNEMRTGKTPTISTHLEESKDILKNNIVICKGGNRFSWQSQLQQFAPSFKVFQYRGTPSKREEILKEYLLYDSYKILISTPATFKMDYRNEKFKKASKKWGVFENLDALVIDEAHFLRKKQTDQTKSLYQLKKGFKVSYLLTGTPGIDKPIDFMQLIKFVEPTINIYEVMEHFFLKIHKKVSRSRTIVEYTQLNPEHTKDWVRWLSTLATQRKTSEVIKFMPAVERDIWTIEMSKKQLAHYNRMKDKAKKQIEINGVSEVDKEQTIITQLIRLQQIATDPGLVEVAKIPLETEPSPKTKLMLEWIKDNPLTPIIIVSKFTSYLEKLGKAIKEDLNIDVAYITGKQSDKAKDKAESDFQNKKVDIILCNSQAAAEGFTLNRATIMFFISRSFKLHENQQVEARFRPNKESEVKGPLQIIDIISKNSIELDILKALKDKKTRNEIINDFKNILNKEN